MGAVRHSVPLSRKTFLRGIAGVAVAGGTHDLQDMRFPIRRDSSPAVQLPKVTVDLSNATGKTVQSHLYGYATGALLDNDSLLAANKAVEGSAGILAPSLIRFNTPAAAIMQKVFARGVSRPDWTPFSRWSQHRASLQGKGGRLIFGIGPVGGDTSLSPAIWAEYARATAVHFRKIGQEITYLGGRQ